MPWPGAGYACFGGGDLSGIYTERAELYDFVRDQQIEGFVTVSGDRHSFWAGYSAKALPPRPFEPVGIAFIVRIDFGAGSCRGARAQLQETSVASALRRRASWR